MRPAEAFGLGLLHGPAELLPVSSSGHMALLGAEPHGDVAVAMHAGTALALLGAIWPLRVALQVGAGAPPSLAGVALKGKLDAGPRRLAGGMLAGALALALADRAPQERSEDEITFADAVVVGLAQACALWPGVSRSGAALTALRARRFTRPAASTISREVGVPLLLGVAAFTAVSAGGGARGGEIVTTGDGTPSGGAHLPLLCGVLGSFVGTLLSLPLLRTLDKPLWPWAAYRAGIALALVGRSARE